LTTALNRAFTIPNRLANFCMFRERSAGTIAAPVKLIMRRAGWEEVVLSPVECLLKAENYATAARMDPSSEHLPTYLRMAALWRARAMQLRLGGRIHVFEEPEGEDVSEPLIWSH
jgi:hypothetical protein